MAAGRSPFSEVPPKTDCQPRHRPGRAACAARGCRLQRPVLMSPMHVDDLDNAILQGRPHFSHDLVEVRGVIKEHHVRFVHIDPRVSSVSGGLRLQNTAGASVSASARVLKTLPGLRRRPVDELDELDLRRAVFSDDTCGLKHRGTTT
jgi:hypothetical protein